MARVSSRECHFGLTESSCLILAEGERMRQTAMHMAAFTGADGVVQFLADNGAAVDVQDKHGETPWSMAAGLSPVLRYRGLYGSHQSTAALMLTLGARSVTQDELDARAAAAR
jgi:Ankyrin repeat